MLYAAYGLVFDSELTLPELTTPLTRMRAADVHIAYGDVPADGLVNGTRIGPFLWTRGNELWLEVRDIARFWVRDGREIIVQPFGDIDEASVRVFLLGSALGALLFQRGFLVLHGNAIRVGDGCLVCVGHSGAGKSTLAAGFLQRGHSLLADDVVAVDRQCRVWPGFPRLKLWKDTADQLGIDTTGLARIRPGIEKFHYPVADRFAGESLPLRWIYILHAHRFPDTRLETLRGMQRFAPLCAHTYRRRYLDGMALKAEHLQLCGQLAGSVHMSVVARPDRVFALDELLDVVLADVAENS